MLPLHPPPTPQPPRLPPEMSGVGIGGLLLEASAKFMGNVDDRGGGLQGVDITVWSNCGDFSAMGYVVDQLDSLIDEWFPGEYLYSVHVGWWRW